MSHQSIILCSGSKQSLEIWMQRHKREHLQPLERLLHLYSLMLEMMKWVRLQSQLLQFKVMWEELNTVWKWLRLAFLLEAGIEVVLWGSSNLSWRSSGQLGSNQTWGYLHQSTVKASLKADMEIIEETTRRDKMWSMRGRLELLSQWWECHQTPNTSCCFYPSSDMGRRQCCFLTWITPGKEALLPKVNHRMSIKGSYSSMPGTWLQ